MGRRLRSAHAAPGMIQGLVADYLRENARADLWESQEARDIFVAKAQPQVDKLHQTFFPGRALLFPGAAVRRQVTAPLVPPSDALQQELVTVAKRFNRRQAKYRIPRRLRALARSNDGFDRKASLNLRLYTRPGELRCLVHTREGGFHTGQKY